MRRLNAAGVPAGVLLAPILPGLTDGEPSIAAVVEAAAEHGAAYFGATALRLPPDVKEHYFGFVGSTFPALLPRYERAYSGTYAPREYQARLEARVARLRARYGFAEDSMRKRDLVPSASTPAVGPAARPASQLSLPI